LLRREETSGEQLRIECFIEDIAVSHSTSAEATPHIHLVIELESHSSKGGLPIRKRIKTERCACARGGYEVACARV
jgi:hypothetical protein